jgi:CheY-like chemotaxis protein
MRILLVEDDMVTAKFVMKGLKEAGYAVDHAGDGETGLHLALDGVYDVGVIDLMLPRLDGLSLISEMRRKKVNTPVIIVSARQSVDDRVKGLQTGGDDYLTKPFAFAELECGKLSGPGKGLYGDAAPPCFLFPISFIGSSMITGFSTASFESRRSVLSVPMNCFIRM